MMNPLFYKETENFNVEICKLFIPDFDKRHISKVVLRLEAGQPPMIDITEYLQRPGDFGAATLRTFELKEIK